jgi:ArsR family transcriptional regulator, arsenate/arsenite/antimonite-responsive transcriptional repressor
MDIATAAERLEALGNPSRLEIYRVLVRAGPDGTPVGEVQRRTGIARSTLSHHLRRLVTVGLVEQRRAGTVLLCSTCYEAMRETLGFLSEECCADAARHGQDAA